MYNNSRRRSRGGFNTRTVLIVLGIVLIVAVLALVLILIDKKTKGSGNTPGQHVPDSPGATAAPGPGADAPEALIISEVMRGDSGFAEILNNSDKAVELSGYGLSDNPNKDDKWFFPTFTLEPGQYAVVNLRGSDYAPEDDEAPVSGSIPEFNAAFKLNSEESGLYIFTRGGYRSDSFVFDAAMPTGLSAVRAGSGVSYTAFPTPGEPNSTRTFDLLVWTDMGEGDPIRISEVLPKNKFDVTDMDGDRSDWLELHNTSSAPVSLLGYCLSDDSLNPGKWAFPDITLQPDEYVLVFLSGKDVTEGGELHASFKISSTDDGLFLSNMDGLRRDCITVPEDLSPNISIGRGENGELLYFPRPTPGEANTSAGFTEYMGVGGFNPSSVYISEVCAVTAPRSHEMDWVELYNGGSEALTLAGWHISDSRSDLEKHELSAVSIPAGGYAAVNCSSSVLDAWAKPAPFDIAPAGETLYLTDANGFIVDVFETGTLKNGVTSGREVGSGSDERVFFDRPTKGEANPSVCLLPYAAAPVFSESGLYHTAPFSVTISTRSADGTVHYTLDGSKPTEQSAVYTGPIAVSENTVIRAVTCAPGRLPSDDTTATYLFETPHTVPVVTLAMAPSDFDEMYAVSKPFVPVVERECRLQYFEKDGTLGVAAPAGVRVSGASTRKYPQKSLGLYFRAGYGRSKITYPFFGNDYITTFGGLVLRQSGQDWGGPRIRDSFTSTAVIDMNIDASAASFCAVYINGRYWGLYDLKENMNEDYLEAHYGIDPDTVNMIQRNNGELAGTNEDFLRVRAFCVQNGSVINMTDERYRQFSRWVDPESFADYVIARQYFPDADMFNQKYWRTNDYQIRWRAIFYDSDFALSSSIGDVLHCYFDPSGTPSANGSLTYFDIQCGLVSNETWKHAFMVRAIYVAKYYLNNERLLPLFDSMIETIRPEMNRQIARWQHPESLSHWQNEVSKLRNMLIERPQYYKQNLMYVMKLSQSAYDALEAEADAIWAENGNQFVNYSFTPEQ